MHDKLLFFDIDGTIWNRDNEICDSTVEAIRLAGKNGHKSFLCSGRSRAYINNPALLEIGFDGIISACGMMVEYNDEICFYKKLGENIIEDTIREVRKHGCRPILEGKDYIYMDYDEFEGDYYGNKLRRELGNRLVQIKDTWGKWEALKISCDTTGADVKKCMEKLNDRFHFIIHGPEVVEMVPKGYSKGTGIHRICSMLNIGTENVIAFGDSPNDVEMFKTAGTSVVMGNGSEDVKKLADYVTTDVDKDGIWNACKHFGII